MSFDPSKPVRTRDGHPAEIVATDLSGPYTIGAILDAPQGKLLIRRNSNGRVWKDRETDADLVNIPREFSMTRHVNVYRDPDDGVCGNFYRNRDAADAYGTGRIACIEVTIKGVEGEGL